MTIPGAAGKSRGWLRRRFRGSRAAEAIMVGVYALTALVVTVQGITHRLPNNFLIFRSSAAYLRAGSDLYAPHPAAYYDLFKYSPTFALLVAPFAILPAWLGLIVWNGLITAAFVYAVARLYARPGDRAIVLLVAWFGFNFAVRGAQTNALIAALMILAVLALDRARFGAGAIAVMLGAIIKLFPIAVLPIAFLRRGWLRLVAACIAIGAVAIALPLIIISPSALRYQYLEWQRVESVDALDRGYSVMGMLHDWFGLVLPNWSVQLAGTVILLAPIIVRLIVNRATLPPELPSNEASAHERPLRAIVARVCARVRRSVQPSGGVPVVRHSCHWNRDLAG